MFSNNQVLLELILLCGPLLALSKQGLPLPFSLAKKKIYLDSHFKEELTDLF